jgi:hypothetical protein
MEKGIGVSEQPVRVTAPQTPNLGDGEGDVAATFRAGAELRRLQTDNVTLDDTRRELLEKLEQRTRRVNQLLGERDLLERQLMRAERALQELNRKLGAALPRAEGTPAARTPTLWPRLQGLLLRRLSRLWPRLGEPNMAPRTQVRSDRPHTQDRSGPLIPFAQNEKARPVIAVVTFGLEPEQRTGVLDIALRFSSERGVVPLVLTDDDDFEPLRSRSMLFEYLPSASVREGFAPALEWDLYLQRRLALIRRKWRPVRVIAFGGPAADLVRLWSESPFEDPSLGRLPAAERLAGPPPGATGGGPLQEA